MCKEKNENRKKIYIRVFIILLLFIIAISIFTYYKKIDYQLRETEETSVIYDKYYAVIFKEEKGEYEKTLLQGVKDAAGGEANAYVKEVGEELAFNLTREEKMDLAIAAKVDAIIVQGENSEGIKKKINEAGKAGIPVITIIEDCLDSTRKSFVGNSRYEIGRTFARQVIDVATSKTKEVYVLDSNSILEENDLFFSGFKETMANEGNHLTINMTVIETGRSPFEAEEKIQEILFDDSFKPDILLILDEGNTNSTIQILVDYNLVGEVKVIGFANSVKILDAISKQIIHSSIYLDSYEIGKDCVSVLIEMETSGYVNTYKTVEVSVINQKNVKNYMEEPADE